MRRALPFLLLLLPLLFLPARSGGETVLAPPSPRASKSSAPASATDVSSALDRAAALVERKDSAALRPLLAWLILVRDGVASPFRPSDFAARLESLLKDAATLDPALPRAALVDALRFRTLAARTAREGFERDEKLSARLRALPGAADIARRTASFEWFGEGDRAGALRLLYILEPRAALDLARPWLSSDNTALRIAAVRLFGLSGDASLGKRFGKLSRDTDLPPELRAEYALAAERLGAGGADLLASFLLSPDLETGLRMRCLSALAALGPAKGADPLMRLVLSGGGDPLLVTRALDLLASWKEPRLTPHLSRFLEKGGPEMKAAAVRAVRLMKVARLYGAVAELLRSGDAGAPLAVECLRCLGESGLPGDMMPLVADFLYDKRFEVRIEAAFALQNLSGEDFGLRRGMDPRELEIILRKVRVWWQERKKAAP